MNRKGFEFSFGWLFAIIVGAAIIALAIYAVTSFVNTNRKIDDSSSSVELSALLKQLETGLEEQGTARIQTPLKTRITNDCLLNTGTISEKTFGVQSIRTSVSSGLGKEEWSDDGVPFRSSSIYLFSNRTIEGESFTTLTERFEYPYKVADLVMIWPTTTKHCFVNSPEEVRKDLESLKAGINFSTSTARCPQGSVKVCFAQAGCEVEVSQTTKTVKKAGKTVYYDATGSALFYAAVFSDADVYECQVQRLAKKAGLLAEIYSEKAQFGAALGCSAETLQPLIDSLESQLNAVRSSRDFTLTMQMQEELRRSNDALICPLF